VEREERVLRERGEERRGRGFEGERGSERRVERRERRKFLWVCEVKMKSSS